MGDGKSFLYLVYSPVYTLEFNKDDEQVLLAVMFTPTEDEKEYAHNYDSNIYGAYQVKTKRKISIRNVMEIV